MTLPYSYADIDIVARTAYGEARSEGNLGMRAVCHVIRNRVRDGRWRNTYAEVCLRSKQFSCWNKGNVNYPKITEVDFKDPTFRVAYSIAANVMAAESDDITLGATHFHHIEAQLPSWADPADMTVSIYHHRFYRL